RCHSFSNRCDAFGKLPQPPIGDASPIASHNIPCGPRQPLTDLYPTLAGRSCLEILPSAPQTFYSGLDTSGASIRKLESTRTHHLTCPTPRAARQIRADGA